MHRGFSLQLSMHPSVRPYAKTIRCTCNCSSVRTYANTTHCTEFFLRTCPSACQSVQSQTHRKVMHDRFESASYTNISHRMDAPSSPLWYTGSALPQCGERFLFTTMPSSQHRPALLHTKEKMKTRTTDHLRCICTL